MLGKPRILSLFPNSFNKFNKHEHSCKILYAFFSAVQNERDRISVRRTSYEEFGHNGALSVSTLLNAEILSRQVLALIMGRSKGRGREGGPDPTPWKITSGQYVS